MRKLLSQIIKWSGLVCVPGGLLWALSPVGVHLSELKFKTPDVFWKLFPSAPALLLIGLIGLHLRVSERSGWLGRAGFLLALLGLLLILGGDVGKFWLGVDDVYIMMAPAYYSFRLGLLVLAGGSILFGLGAPRSGPLPTWGVLPLVLGSLCGLVAFMSDLGSFGAMLWMLFGIGWVWLGCALLVASVLPYLRIRSSNP